MEAGESKSFFDDDDDTLSEAVVVDDISPPNPLPVVELLVPKELKRSPNDDIRSPPRLPSPMSPPRPLDDVGLNRDELVEAPVVVAVVPLAAVEVVVPFVAADDDE